MPGQAIYSTSKAGVRAFTEALWTELDGTSVRLTCGASWGNPLPR